MSAEPEQRARAGPAPQRLVKFECVRCHTWYLSDARGSNLCRCDLLPMPHPADWIAARRDHLPSDNRRAQRLWNEHYGDARVIWLCPECWADVEPA
jgi:hypothetical protein